MVVAQANRRHTRDGTPGSQLDELCPCRSCPLQLCPSTVSTFEAELMLLRQFGEVRRPCPLALVWIPRKVKLGQSGCPSHQRWDKHGRVCYELREVPSPSWAHCRACPSNKANWWARNKSHLGKLLALAPPIAVNSLSTQAKQPLPTTSLLSFSLRHLRVLRSRPLQYRSFTMAAPQETQGTLKIENVSHELC